MAQESYKISKYLDWDLLKIIRLGVDKIKCVFYRYLSLIIDIYPDRLKRTPDN